MSASSEPIQKAIALSKAGDRLAARLMLQELIQAEPQNEMAWLWYVDTFSGDAERLAALEEFLLACPESRRGLAAISEVRQRLAASAADAVEPERPPQPPPAWQPPPPARAVKKGAKARPARTWPLFLVWFGLALVAGTVIFYGVVVYERKIRSLQAQNTVLLEKSVLLSAQYEAMQNASLDLMQQRDAIQGQYDQLNDNYARLTLDYYTLSQDFEKLSQRNVQLIEDYNGLVARFNGLIDEYNLLTEQQYALEEENAYYRTVAITPPYIYIYQRIVYLTFESTQGELVTWTFPFESLEEDIRRGNSSREMLLNRIFDVQRVSDPNTGQDIYLLDLRKYVDPTPFHDYIEVVYRESANDEDFINEVWNVVAQLSTYSYELEETPRYPLETFLAGGGDCEDTAILFASMIQAAPVDWKVGLFYMDGENPSAFKNVNHVAVWIDTGSRTHVIETTSKTEREPFDKPYGWIFQLN